MTRRRRAASATRGAAAPAAPRAPAAAPWRNAIVPALLFALAWWWRLAYLGRLDATPLAGVLQGDERDYWSWANTLLANHFSGHNAFFQGPLYPYALALLRRLTGAGLAEVLRAQAALGALAVALLADAARRVAGPWAALAVGAVLAFHPVSVLFDGLVLAESLLFALEALLLWLCVRAARAPSWRAFVAIALVAGLAAQCRATSALLLAPALALAWRAGAPARAAAWRRTLLVAGVFALTVAPSAAWNAARAGGFVPWTYNLGYNLYVGNNPDGNGAFVTVAGAGRFAPVPGDAADGGADGDGRDWMRATQRLLPTPVESSRWWAARAGAFVRAHPGHALALAGRKLLLMWNRHETPQLEDASLFDRLAGPLGLPPGVAFALLAIAGLAGVALAGALGPLGLALRLWIVAVVAGVLPFFVTDRYRHHLVPALALLAAFGLAETVRRARAAKARALRAPAFAALGALLLVMLPVRERDVREDAWRASRDLASRWLDHGEPRRAAEEFERALALQHELGLDADPDPSTAGSRALLDYGYGVALHRLGRDAEALPWLRRAVDDDTTSSVYVRTLADAYLVNGREREGDSLLAKLGGMVGGAGEMWISRGWQAARDGRLDSAEVRFRRAVAADERLFGGWTALVRVQVQRGEIAEARATLARAAALRLPEPSRLAHEALVAAAAGDRAAAERALDAIPPAALEGDRLLRHVVADARARLAHAP